MFAESKDEGVGLRGVKGWKRGCGQMFCLEIKRDWQDDRFLESVWGRFDQDGRVAAAHEPMTQVLLLTLENLVRAAQVS